MPIAAWSDGPPEAGKPNHRPQIEHFVFCDGDVFVYHGILSIIVLASVGPVTACSELPGTPTGDRVLGAPRNPDLSLPDWYRSFLHSLHLPYVISVVLHRTSSINAPTSSITVHLSRRSQYICHASQCITDHRMYVHLYHQSSPHTTDTDTLHLCISHHHTPPITIHMARITVYHRLPYIYLTSP